MDNKDLEKLLKDVKSGTRSVEEALHELQSFSIKDLGFAKLDYHRELRRGYPEIVYAAGKSVVQLEGIVRDMLEHDNNIIITKASKKKYDVVKKLAPKAKYYKEAKIISIRKKEPVLPKTYISVITAGTSDIPVAEEAAVTAELLGNTVRRIFDVGVAGIHRLTVHLDEIRKSRVVIVIAGMEGALASIVAGLVNIPVIAVPTSVGYGANLQGISALLAMLTSCSGGVAVVNIDNGFGAGYYAGMINRL
ncbi:MAG TPA: nickel pincer cofactor biosynthesis protein LarB [Bacteroidetes bacterium]|nr:nickel pincer cofactor biosynthesis protein LarB [Bacteroidota bacterium]